MSFVSSAKHVLQYELEACKDNNPLEQLRIFENYQKAVIGHFLKQWKEKQLYAGFRTWLEKDHQLKSARLEVRAQKILMVCDDTEDDTTRTNQSTVASTLQTRTPKEVADVINWLHLWQTETLSLAELNPASLQHLGHTVGPILCRSPSNIDVFHDSDPSDTLGIWLILSGTVTLLVDANDPSKNVLLEKGEKFTSYSLSLQSLPFTRAVQDEQFNCHVGFSAVAAAVGTTSVLFISKHCLRDSIGILLTARKNRKNRSSTMEKFVQLLIGNKYSSSSSSSSTTATTAATTQLQDTVHRLAKAATVEQLNRKSIVRPRPLHLGVLETGTFTVYTATTKSKSKSNSKSNPSTASTSKKTTSAQKTQVAVITELGSIIHCSASEANKKKSKKLQFTLFEHEIVVSSSVASVVWVPLVSLDNSGDTLRTALSSIVEKQARQRQDRSNAATSTLNHVSQHATNQRRQQAADVLADANLQAEELKAHISEFMDWKNKADEEMCFDALDLSPARPSLSVVSPTKSRWTWNHQERDLVGKSGSGGSGVWDGKSGDGWNPSAGVPKGGSKSKYVVRKTYD